MKSGLARIIDVRHSSNLLAVVATFVAGGVGLVVGLIDGAGVVDAFGDGVIAGGAAFLAWAIARELDPDSPLTAAVAAPLGVGAWFFDAPGLLVTAGALLAARIVARTTGVRLTSVDLAFLILLAAAMAGRPGGLIAAITLGVAVAFGGTSRSPRLRYSAALLMAMSGAVIAALWGDPLGHTDLDITSGLWAGAAVAAAVLTPLDHPRSLGDYSRKPLQRQHLRLARWGAAGLAVVFALVGGSEGVIVVGPLLAAMVALPVSELIELAQVGRPMRTSTPPE